MISEDDKKKIFSLLDLTSLNDNDNAATIAALCEKAVGPLGHVAAVCVYPECISYAVEALRNTSIKIATVANFPHGIEEEAQILASIAYALNAGANEIDVVFPYRRYLQGDKKGALNIITACRNFIGSEIILKVILETGVLSNLSTIEEVSEKLILAGANFLKTSTGKVTVGATLEAASTILYAIKASGANVGFKASGGIRTVEQAMLYIRLAQDIMGKDWVTPEHFRIGTSGIQVIH